MSLQNVNSIWKQMSAEDKQAVKDLIAEQEKLGKHYSLAAMIQATTPGMPDPVIGESFKM